MRVLLQRVSRAEVRVGAPPRTTGRIARGYLLLVGLTHADSEAELVWMADKIVGLRLFSDADDKMNLSLADVGGALLVVSQFTLYGDAAKGRRPSFVDAARPEVAIPRTGRSWAKRATPSSAAAKIPARSSWPGVRWMAMSPPSLT